MLVFRDSQGNISRSVDLHKTSRRSKSSVDSQDETQGANHGVDGTGSPGDIARVGAEDIGLYISDEPEGLKEQDALSCKPGTQPKATTPRMGELNLSEPRSAHPSVVVLDETERNDIICFCTERSLEK